MKGRFARYVTLAAASAAALVLVGCRSAPVMNVVDAPVVVGSGKAVTKQTVRNVIMQSGSGLGWQMQDVDSHTLQGTLYLRSHMAQVEIPYSATSYSINYKNSTNLDYNGTNIHSNYNGWVQNLDRTIKARLIGE